MNPQMPIEVGEEAAMQWEIKKVEYRVRPVTRWIVTRYEEIEHGGAVSSHGQFDNEHIAYEVGDALARAERDRLGWSASDERMSLPTMPDHARAGRLT